jgi:hypothetical protein
VREISWKGSPSWSGIEDYLDQALRLALCKITLRHHRMLFHLRARNTCAIRDPTVAVSYVTLLELNNHLSSCAWLNLPRDFSWCCREAQVFLDVHSSGCELVSLEWNWLTTGLVEPSRCSTCRVVTGLSHQFVPQYREIMCKQ